jgi:mevalonate kinase
LKKTFYSNGKLLITGEYLVLNGVKAFALPTKFGQNLSVEEGNDNQIEWKSFDSDGSTWFQEIITFKSIIEKEIFEDKTKTTLVEILHEAYLQNTKFIENSKGYKITTELTFPKFWGLGTSSTLLNNLGQWLKVNPYKILKNTFGGSGYDIANAQNDFPITFQIQNGEPVVEKVDFKRSFTDSIYFVYLNKKQSSKASIAVYLEKQNDILKVVSQIEEITKIALETKDLNTFSEAMQNHESVMSGVLEMKTVRAKYFSDFDGVVKSLGAWGGDFIMVISEENPSDYFKKKGFGTILTYKEMIL